MTRNTCSIHHYTSSWSSAKFTRFHVFETKIMKIFGPKVSDFYGKACEKYILQWLGCNRKKSCVYTRSKDIRVLIIYQTRRLSC